MPGHRCHHSQAVTDTWRHHRIALPTAMLAQVENRNMSHQPQHEEVQLWLLCVHLSVHQVVIQ